VSTIELENIQAATAAVQPSSPPAQAGTRSSLSENRPSADEDVGDYIKVIAESRPHHYHDEDYVDDDGSSATISANEDDDEEEEEVYQVPRRRKLQKKSSSSLGKKRHCNIIWILEIVQKIIFFNVFM